MQNIESKRVIDVLLAFFKLGRRDIDHWKCSIRPSGTAKCAQKRLCAHAGNILQGLRGKNRRGEGRARFRQRSTENRLWRLG
jgi:hypothetical protein